jgi:hypothetical protein
MKELGQGDGQWRYSVECKCGVDEISSAFRLVIAMYRGERERYGWLRPRRPKQSIAELQGAAETGREEEPDES